MDNNNQQPLERRSEQRQKAAGRLMLEIKGSPPKIIEVELLDVSPKGFKVRHSSPKLTPGQEVLAERPWGEVARWQFEARVIWRREYGAEYQTGLCIV